MMSDSLSEMRSESPLRRPLLLRSENARTLVFGCVLLLVAFAVRLMLESIYGQPLSVQTDRARWDIGVRDPLRIPRLLHGFTSLFSLVGIFVVVMALLRAAFVHEDASR